MYNLKSITRGVVHLSIGTVTILRKLQRMCEKIKYKIAYFQVKERALFKQHVYYYTAVTKYNSSCDTTV